MNPLEMNLQKSLERISDLSALFVQTIKARNILDLYDINRISENILIPIFKEVYGYENLVNLNTKEKNYPGIDLGDEQARVAIQVTSTADSAKIKHTLERFIENEEYRRYKQLIVYIITEKQGSYRGRGWTGLIDGRFTFRNPEDIRDYRDLLQEIESLPLEKVQRVEAILEEQFGGDAAAEEEHLHAYLDMTMRQCSGITLAPLDQAAKERRYLTMQRIFINLDAGSSARGMGGMAKEPSFSSVIGHAHENEHLILLGDPGSGKTTVLRYLGLCLAGANDDPAGGWLEHLNWEIRKPKSSRGEMLAEQAEGEAETATWSSPAPIPVIITLRHFARTAFDPQDSQAVWGYVCQMLEREKLAEVIPALQRKAHGGELIFLFDGVDEVPVGQRVDVWQAIASMDRGSCGGNRWIATCRVLSFNEDELPQDGIPVRTVQPLNRRQISEFVTHWFKGLTDAGELSQTVATEKERQLQEATEREYLRELAENPMLLTIMALVQTYYATLPHERVMLYQACVDTLLFRWQLHKEDATDADMPDVLTQLDVQRQELERLMWQIGWTAHERAILRKEDADISQSEVLRIANDVLGSYAKAEKFIEYTEERAHLLIGRGGVDEPVYGFPHRTFQEYLAACHLAADRRFGRKASDLAAEGDTWREVLLLATGTLVFNRNNREKALDAIEDVLPPSTPVRDDRSAWRRVWLAGEMLAEVGQEAAQRDDVGQELLPKLRQELISLMDKSMLPIKQRAAAGDALGKLGDSRKSLLALEEMRFCWMPPGPFIMGSDDPELRIQNESLGEDMQPVKHENEVPYGYWLGEWPVTNAQYASFVAAGGYEKAAYWEEAEAANVWRDGVVHGYYWDGKSSQKGSGTAAYDFGDPFNLPNHPVVGICWYEALAFSRWLTEKWHSAGLLAAGWEITLPSELEWEKAARGGLAEVPLTSVQRTIAQGVELAPYWESKPNELPERKFPWGNDFNLVRAMCRETELSATSALGVMRSNASPYGCREMSGNVFEWMRSIYGHYADGKITVNEYPYEAEKKRETAAGGVQTLRSIRGGSWDAGIKWQRCACRHWGNPSSRGSNVGFRVVVSPFISER